jgi:hypothetical protein
VGTLFKNRSPRLILALGVLTKHNRITQFPVIFAFLTGSNFVRFLINILRSNLAAVICARGYRYRGGGSPGTPFTLYSHVHEDNEFEARCPLCTTLPVAPYIAYLQYLSSFNQDSASKHNTSHAYPTSAPMMRPSRRPTDSPTTEAPSARQSSSNNCAASESLKSS